MAAQRAPLNELKIGPVVHEAVAAASPPLLGIVEHWGRHVVLASWLAFFVGGRVVPLLAAVVLALQPSLGLHLLSFGRRFGRVGSRRRSRCWILRGLRSFPVLHSEVCFVRHVVLKHLVFRKHNAVVCSQVHGFWVQLLVRELVIESRQECLQDLVHGSLTPRLGDPKLDLVVVTLDEHFERCHIVVVAVAVVAVAVVVCVWKCSD